MILANKTCIVSHRVAIANKNVVGSGSRRKSKVCVCTESKYNVAYVVRPLIYYQIKHITLLLKTTGIIA